MNSVSFEEIEETFITPGKTRNLGDSFSKDKGPSETSGGRGMEENCIGVKEDTSLFTLFLIVSRTASRHRVVYVQGTHLSVDSNV